MRPSHRLDLLVVPERPEDPFPAEGWTSLHQQWIREGALDADGRPGPAAPALVFGGFARVRVDPADIALTGAPETPRLYANQQGGFRVRCPTCQTSVVPAFWRALEAWRAAPHAGSRRLRCPHCHTSTALEGLSYAPPAAFARWALVFVDVGGIHLSEQARSACLQYLDTARTVLRRV